MSVSKGSQASCIVCLLTALYNLNLGIKRVLFMIILNFRIIVCPNALIQILEIILHLIDLLKDLLLCFFSI